MTLLDARKIVEKKINELKYRVEKLKIRIEQDSTKMYKDEYVVIDLSKLN